MDVDHNQLSSGKKLGRNVVAINRLPTDVTDTGGSRKDRFVPRCRRSYAKNAAPVMNGSNAKGASWHVGSNCVAAMDRSRRSDGLGPQGACRPLQVGTEPFGGACRSNGSH